MFTTFMVLCIGTMLMCYYSYLHSGDVVDLLGVGLCFLPFISYYFNITNPDLLGYGAVGYCVFSLHTINKKEDIKLKDLCVGAIYTLLGIACVIRGVAPIITIEYLSAYNNIIVTLCGLLMLCSIVRWEGGILTRIIQHYAVYNRGARSGILRFNYLSEV